MNGSFIAIVYSDMDLVNIGPGNNFMNAGPNAERDDWNQPTNPNDNLSSCAMAFDQTYMHVTSIRSKMLWILIFQILIVLTFVGSGTFAVLKLNKITQGLSPGLQTPSSS